MTDYTALRGIAAPGTAVFGYQRGHEITAAVVAAWGLTVGEPGDPDADVCEGPIPTDAPTGPVLARPGDGANRAAWEAYAVAHGMTADKAAEASIEDLQADRDAKGRVVERPAENAKKADWVTYVTKLGADKAWAEADTTTRADLQAWTPDAPAAPVPGDTVAVAATDATQQL